MQPYRHLGRIESDYAPANNYDLARRNTRDTAKQDPASTMGFFKCRRAGLDRHATGDLAHWFQKRKTACIIRDRLISNADSA